MIAPAPSPRPLRRRLYVGAYVAFLVVAFLAAAEVVVRLQGWRPWQRPAVDIRVAPGGRLFAKDPRLGFTHLPGSYTVTIAGGYTFHLTHGADTHRITRPPGGPRGDRVPEIWIFGCSYTHGWTVNDDQSYPWLVQEALPGYEVVNFGCSSYGTVHALLQLEEALATRPPPAATVYAAASFHADRNTFARSRRKFTAALNRLGVLVHPFARFDRAGALTIGVMPVEFRGVPLMGVSAFANFLEEQLERRDERSLRSHEVTLALIDRMAELARSRGVPLVVAGIEHDESTADLVRHAESIGVVAADISVDLSVPGNSNLPYDPHPGPRAHREYALRLTACLRDRVLR